MMRRHRRDCTIGPSRPVFADERMFGLKLVTRAKLFVVLALLVPVLLVAELLQANEYAQTNHDLTQENARDIARLACLLVEFTPQGNTLGDEIRVKYLCSPFSAPRRAPVVTPTPTPTLRSTSTAPSRPERSASSSAPPRQRQTPVVASSRRHESPSKPRPSPTVDGVPMLSGVIAEIPGGAQAVETLCQSVPLICSLPV